MANSGEKPFADDLFKDPKPYADDLFKDPDDEHIAIGPDADRWWAESNTGKVATAFGLGVANGWGAMRTAADETDEYLRKAGIFNDYLANKKSVYGGIAEAFLMGPLHAAYSVAGAGLGVLSGLGEATGRYGEILDQGAKEQLAEEPTTFLGQVRQTLGTPITYAQGAASDALKGIASGYLPEAGVNVITGLQNAGIATRYSKARGVLERIHEARANGSIGEGEQGYFNTVHPSPEDLATRQRAAEEAGIDPPKPEPPRWNIDEVARDVDPDTFEKWDFLEAQRDKLINDLRSLSDLRKDHYLFKDAQEIIDKEIKETSGLDPSTLKGIDKERLFNQAVNFLEGRDDVRRDVLLRARNFIDGFDHPEAGSLREQLYKTRVEMSYLRPKRDAALEHAEELIPTLVEAPTIEVTGTPLTNTETQTGSPVKTGEDGTVTFKTSKGSTYQAHSDGSTTRNKSFHPEHGPEDVGLKPKSEKTFYVTNEQIEKLSEFQAEGGPAKILAPLGDGRWGLKYTEGENKGKFETRTVITPTNTPSKGLSPVEVWNKGSKVHFGNEIVEVGQPVSEIMATAAEADSKPITPVAPETHVTSGQTATIAEESLGNTNQFKVRGLTRNLISGEYESEYLHLYGDIELWGDAFETMSRAEKLKVSDDWVFNNYDKAFKLLKDGGTPPKGMPITAVVMSFKKYATQIGDFESIRSLANNADVSKKVTHYAQNLSMLAERDPNDPYSGFRKVVESRERAAKNNKIDIEKARKAFEDDIDSLLENGMAKQDVDNFILSIICK